MSDVMDPLTKTDATFQKRLINFETGKAVLRAEHETWLGELATETTTTREFTCHIYGFASKLGQHDRNVTLSYDRANAVAGFLEKRNPLYTTRIDQFEAQGDDNYKGRGDNDAIWRAVEVHVFMRATPVPPKPNVTPVPKPRGLKWSVSGKSLGLASNPIN
jgi:hypothetical protein